jgi:hypothetical protein
VSLDSYRRCGVCGESLDQPDPPLPQHELAHDACDMRLMEQRGYARGIEAAAALIRRRAAPASGGFSGCNVVDADEVAAILDAERGLGKGAGE